MQTATNPDHSLIHRFLAQATQPLAVDSNRLAAELGIRLTDWDAQACVLCLSACPAEQHLQGNGVVQGGILTTLLDFSLAFVVMAVLTPPRSAATVALNVHFERPVPHGEVSLRARIDRLGSSLAFASAELGPTGLSQVWTRATATLALRG
jgi:uncharacterized protein (TIGR00369 family)